MHINAEIGYYRNDIENEASIVHIAQLYSKLTTFNNVACVSVQFFFVGKYLSNNYFSSYNKQWQDAQIAMVDMLGLELPAQPRAPENVCYLEKFINEIIYFLRISMLPFN